MTGGYDPTETPPDSRLVQAQSRDVPEGRASSRCSGRGSPGSWPGVTFTGAPLSCRPDSSGSAHGGGAHAPDEYWLIESANPKVAGMDGAVRSYVELFYALAQVR